MTTAERLARRARWRPVAMAAALALVLATSIALERNPWGQRRQDIVQQRDVPSGLLQTGGLGNILQSLGVLIPVANPGTVYPRPSWSQEPADMTALIFRDKGRPGTVLYSAHLQGREALPSTRAVPPERRAGPVPTLSVSVSQEALYDPRNGLLSRRAPAAGEHPATITWFTQDGAIEWTGGVGLRLHGDARRASRRPSFRLEFRGLYGAQRAEDYTGAEELVLREDNPLYVNREALALARQAGALAPAWEPVRLVLNGEDWGPYLVSPRVREETLAARWGGEVLAFVELEGDPGATGAWPEPYRALGRWAEDESTSMTLARARERVDLDALEGWAAAAIVTESGRPFEGEAVLWRPSPEEPPRWTWIVEDLGRSFDQSPLRRDGREPLPWLLNHPEPRAVLLRRLLAEDPAAEAWLEEKVALLR